MASASSSETEGSLSLGSHDTALCLIPPRHLWPAVDRLRAHYDQASEKWPPHVNLIYPFVRPDSLSAAASRIQSVLAKQNLGSSEVKLDGTGVFTRARRGNIIYRHDTEPDRCSSLRNLRGEILRGLGHGSMSGSGQFQMHMTVAQSEDASASAHRFLVDKVGFLPEIGWDVDRVYLLVRERVQLEGGATSQMKIWGTVSLSGELSVPERPAALYEAPRVSGTLSECAESELEGTGEVDGLHSHPPYYFDDETTLWTPFLSTSEYPFAAPTTLTVASYNVLAEFEHPPSADRYPLLLRTILSSPAAADVLILQEVTDHFLNYLLASPEIRERFPFSSSGPPCQEDIEPLPSFLNLVILSRYPFASETVSLLRRHKTVLVARFPGIIPDPDSDKKEIVVAGVHLSCGLTDGSVAAKKADVSRLLKYLTDKYAGNPWIVAGDFNLSTSKYTIDAAREKGALSALSAGHLKGVEEILAGDGLVDAWAACRHHYQEEDDEKWEEGEGEEGATYNPTVNEVAAAIVGSGYGMRPQRYDRVYVRGEKLLKVEGFHRFGMTKGTVGDGESYASDHWGVRCVLHVGDDEPKMSDEIERLAVPVELVKAEEGVLAESVDPVLSGLGVFPTDDDMSLRKTALSLLKSTLLDPPAENTARRPTVVVIPVGSYALGVWTSSSDMDILCIGPFSAATFFSLATQRLRRVQDIRILRRVHANTGTMLEIQVLGVKMDLQYCPATSVAEQWPRVLRAPASHPVWSLPPSTLAKLKAIRDVDYLRRSVPDLGVFRLAHRFVKTWARSRGIYAARFGFLGGIQISLMLARVYKLLPGSVSVQDLLVTFFEHYATFPFATHPVFDPLFHHARLPYTRSSREPLAILGYFPPSLNTTPFASLPSTATLTAEFHLAASLLREPGTTWTSFLSRDGASAFLATHKSYVKISIQYWGLSLARGSRFVGWVESRCVMLLVDIARRAGGITARMWPARFLTSPDPTKTHTQTTEDGAEGEQKDYTGCYLIGLGKTNDDMTRDDLQLALGGLRSALGRFEEAMRADAKYFDPRSCWLAAELVNRTDLGDMSLDVREWGEYNPGEEEDSDSEEEDDDDEDEPLLAADKKKKGKKGKVTEEETVRLEPGKKFRTAADVMNRLRWDHHLDSADFLVGYEDRFVGAREKALDAWKTEQTDEEFIPQHRILYFKKKDGEVVWERRTRVDLLFGSGV